MADLSPQAQAVYEAATTAAIRDNADWPVTIAAALRAVADQVVEDVSPVESIIAIAHELENHS